MLGNLEFILSYMVSELLGGDNWGSWWFEEGFIQVSLVFFYFCWFCWYLKSIVLDPSLIVVFLWKLFVFSRSFRSVYLLESSYCILRVSPCSFWWRSSDPWGYVVHTWRKLLIFWSAHLILVLRVKVTLSGNGRVSEITLAGNNRKGGERSFWMANIASDCCEHFLVPFLTFFVD